jgi:hypothetical protein
MGRLIRHAGPTAPLPVRALPIPMIEPAFRTPLVPAVGGTALLAPGNRATRRTAIALPPIAMLTNPEHRLASLAAANSLPENYFSMNRHLHKQADFDNGNGSCQGRTSFDWWPSHEGCRARTPLLPTAGFYPPSKPQYNLSLECFEADDGRIIAPSAPMMSPGRPTPAKDSETTFPDDRQQLWNGSSRARALDRPSLTSESAHAVGIVPFWRS